MQTRAKRSAKITFNTSAQQLRNTRKNVRVKKISVPRKVIAKKSSSKKSVRNASANHTAMVDNCETMSSFNPFLAGTVQFCRKDPASWFRQLEAIFAIQKIDEVEARYMYLQARLEPIILSEVSDFFQTPPTANKYKALKDRILRQYEDSRDKQVAKVLEEVYLSDRRPSDMLRKMQKLAGTDLSEG